MDVTIRAEVLARVGALDLQVVVGALWVGNDGGQLVSLFLLWKFLLS